MKFTKMHGAGNDYIYFNCFEEKIEDPKALSIRLSDRHFSVGGDGIVLIMPSDVADFRMRMFNTDGSEGRMCGNASRCIGKYVYEKGLTDKTVVTLETLAGIKTLKLDVKDGVVESVCVDMGKAEFESSKIPVISDKSEVINEPLEIGGKEYHVTCVSMGNPHCVTFVDEIKNLELMKIGVLFENNEIFPERVNTEFIRVIDQKTLEMRVWERGSGETLACGTGACASVAAAVRNGICKAGDEITVKLFGGDLFITCSEDFSIQMRGGAEFAFEGYID
ncbi:MAG: diaminopimelate epimerase [Oscillospiraceae bacterium]|nr:diaminopimelate epimerase [Oscillospiraceae bacterium]